MKQLRECPVCGSRSISLFYLHRQPQVVKSWQVFRCEACTLGFLHPQLSWQELAPYYSDNYAAYDELHGAQEDLEQAVARSRSAGEFHHVPMREGMRLLDGLRRRLLPARRRTPGGEGRGYRTEPGRRRAGGG